MFVGRVVLKVHLGLEEMVAIVRRVCSSWNHRLCENGLQLLYYWA